MKAGALLATTILLLSGCGDDSHDSSAPDTFTVKGEIVLTSYDGVNYADRGRAGEECWGEQGYEDMAAGAQVVIRDSRDEQVGLGRLEAGSLAQPWRQGPACTFPFEVSGVPASGELYTVEVARRGTVTFKRAEADAVSLTLG